MAPLKIWQKKENLTLIELHDRFLNSHGALDARYTKEGLHLNSKGYVRWAKILRPYLQGVIKNRDKTS